ncbi:MAG TPA: hypothetical protein VFY43_06605 [Candidatus Limnocylindria bacterium]|nr:hypothetical protein [Candidatus Limnocylindria bacterium]
MPSQQPLDQIPFLLFVVLLFAFCLAAYEVGFRVGKRRQEAGETENEGPTGMIVGAILALMAFLLAIAMGMAGDRFDVRRGLVQQEANAIGTTYLRAGYLPEPASSELRELLVEYTPLRIATSDRGELQTNIDRSVELQHEMWGIAQDVARENSSDVVALFLESLNEVIDVHSQRITAGLYARVPPTILWLLIGGVVLSLGLVGYSAGLSGKHALVIAVILILTLGTVIALVIDIDRPADGFIETSQQPLISLQDSIQSYP